MSLTLCWLELDGWRIRCYSFPFIATPVSIYSYILAQLLLMSLLDSPNPTIHQRMACNSGLEQKQQNVIESQTGGE